MEPKEGMVCLSNPLGFGIQDSSFEGQRVDTGAIWVFFAKIADP